LTTEITRQRTMISQSRMGAKNVSSPKTNRP